MANETVSQQINALAQRVGEEIKEVKVSLGSSGAKPWKAEWTTFEAAQEEGTYYLTEAEISALSSDDFPDEKPANITSEAFLKVIKLGEGKFSQELYLGKAIFYRRVPCGDLQDSNKFGWHTGYPSTTRSAYHNGGLKHGWLPMCGMEGNIGYAPGWTVPLVFTESNPGMDPVYTYLKSGYPSSQFKSSTATGDIYIDNGNEFESWVKYVAIESGGTVSLGDKWSWANNEVPTIGKGFLVAAWCHSMGIVNFIPSEGTS